MPPTATITPLMAALPTIYAVMDRANVAFLYKEEPKGTWSPAAPETPAAAPPSALCHPVAGRGGQAVRREADDPAGLAPDEQSAWDEIQRCRKDGAEVVCIINSRDGQGKSKVIVLDHHPSPAFLTLLKAPQPPPWKSVGRGRRSWNGTPRPAIATTSRSQAPPRASDSNIHDHFGQPAVAVTDDLQAVPGDGLHFHVELMPLGVDRFALRRGLQTVVPMATSNWASTSRRASKV